ncbi:hypothetical protein BKH46_04075 [Helicobacter sp. 12S02634-8]|uniref:hypothetical protein n=1 Tax=Helicobacter sp. 12S02634-8 TaxID=1476199 RepID=UPI000BA55EB8|nr:hypothetical protein [Helicobacter sp. 12S02634-8]PAF47267.1 hypothetical protein BKH46_04075 [Helicobacter sp. 12S02634-8]
MEVDFAKVCKDNGFPTRIVPCLLPLAYGIPCVDTFAEYQHLSTDGSDTLGKWLENLKHKANASSNAFGNGENAVILEVLIQIYHKLNTLEALIKDQAPKLLALDFQTSIQALGHGVICANQGAFEPSQEYYLRFELPIFPQRYIGAFGKAFDTQILQITQMHSRDIQDFDMYIANQEIEYLRRHKYEKSQPHPNTLPMG